MTAREPDPVAPVKPCPLCQAPGRESTSYEHDRTGKPWTCDPCDLFFEGTATEFQKYRIAESVAAAEAMTTRPEPDGGNR